MKSVLLGAICLGSSVVLCAQDAPDKNLGPVGRYQFIVANVVTPDSKSETLFKIDTTTGQAWRFVSAGVTIPENKRLNPQIRSFSTSGWVPISESYASDFQRALNEIEKMPLRSDRGSNRKEEKTP